MPGTMRKPGQYQWQKINFNKRKRGFYGWKKAQRNRGNDDYRGRDNRGIVRQTAHAALDGRPEKVPEAYSGECQAPGPGAQRRGRRGRVRCLGGLATTL